MKKNIFFLYMFLMAVQLKLYAQDDPPYPPTPPAPLDIVKAEYFVDTVSGFGSGTPISLTAGVDISNIPATINTSSLTVGVHRLYIRTLNAEGEWSLTSVRQFEVLPKVVLSGALTGNFKTLKEAFDAINVGGGSGNVTVTVVDNTTETMQASLNQTNYTVLVVPHGNRVVQGNLSTALILLNQADNVTIDGLSQTGPNTLTIRNTNTGLDANAIRIFGEALKNTIRRCIIEGSASGNSSISGIVVITVDAQTSRGNVIDSNLIRPASAAGSRIGISIARQFTNNSTGKNDSTQVLNNRIENVFVNNASNRGILVSNGANNTIIRGNSVYNSDTLTNTTNGAFYVPIQVSNVGGSGTTIDSNYVGGSLPAAGGGNMVIRSPANSFNFVAIQISDDAINPTSVTRNIVRNLDLDIANSGTTILNPFRVINVIAANLQAYNNNIIGSETNNSIILHMRPGNTGATGSFGHLIQTTCATPIAHNFVGGLTVTNTPLSGSTTTPFLNLIDVRGNITSLNLKNNTVGSATAGNISLNSTTAGAFIVRGITVNSTAVSPVLNIDTNTVRNITATGGPSLLAIRNFFGSVSTTSSNVTMNGNTISNVSVSGNSGNISGLLNDLATSVNNLSQLISVDGNQVSNLTAPSGSGTIIHGIRIQNFSSAVNRMRGRITNNNINGLVNSATGSSVSSGIAVSNDINTTDSLVIAGNSINNLVSNATTVSTGNISEGNGITYETKNSGINGLVVTRDNVISNISVQTTNNQALRVSGIMLFGNNTLVERNRVFGLSNAATSASAKITGLFVRSRSDDANVAMIRNNMMAINTNSTAMVAGMEMGDSAVKANVYHNSLLTEGNIAGKSYAFFKTGTAVADVKNNILYNAAAGTAFAIGLQTNAAGYTGNNNYFVSPAAASLGEIGGVAQTIAAWRTTTSQDANTENGTSGINTNAANLFINKAMAQLFINSVLPTDLVKIANNGMPLAAVPFDFLGNSRSATTPDIGAHEFIFSPPLPLRLLSFTGKLVANNAVLDWKTTDERNTSHFEVEKSENGINYRKIGTVRAQSGAGIHDYGFTDPAITGVVFYRLKMVDVDGRVTYSDIIRLSNHEIINPVVYPNPARNEITISGLRQNGMIRLINLYGQVLSEQKVAEHSMVIDIGHYPGGIYWLQYWHNGEVIKMQVIKQ